MSHNNFKDLFSGHANDYALHRPTYPRELFEYLANLTREHALAWDCGTGNGQAAVALAEFYHRVIATDASKDQIAQAKSHEKIKFAVAPAEVSGLEQGSVDLVTVAQALHWFKHAAFWQEVKRVGKPGSIIAVWSYSLPKITDVVDQEVRKFYDRDTADYWEPERALVDGGYRSLEFPFEEMRPPEFFMKVNWTLDQYLGYINTWSAVKTATKKTGVNPAVAFAETLHKVWGDPHASKVVSWRVLLRVGKIK